MDRADDRVSTVEAGAPAVVITVPAATVVLSTPWVVTVLDPVVKVTVFEMDVEFAVETAPTLCDIVMPGIESEAIETEQSYPPSEVIEHCMPERQQKNPGSDAIVLSLHRVPEGSAHCTYKVEVRYGSREVRTID